MCNEFDKNMGFDGAYEVTDRNLIAILRKYDEKNGTQEEKRYKELLEDGVKKQLDESKGYIDIVYDLTGCKKSDLPKNIKRDIKRLAKYDDKFDIAGYIKEKGFFGRLLDSLRQPKLEAGKPEEFKYNAKPKYTVQELEHMSKDHLSIEDAYKFYMEEKDTEGFDKKEFYKQLQRGGFSVEELGKLSQKISEKTQKKSFKDEIKFSGGSKGKFSTPREPKDGEATRDNDSSKMKFSGGSKGKFSTPREQRDDELDL